MGAEMHGTRSGRAWGLAERQHGVVARAQLLGLGFSAKAIRHRMATGRLRPVYLGVYSVGRRELTREGRWMAAVLASGNRAVLSHRSAAALWEIAQEPRDRIDVSVCQAGKIHRPGVLVRSRPALREREIGMERGIPLTQPVRTLIDIATELTPRELERAVNEADSRGRVDAEALRLALDDHVGEPGVPALRRLLDRHTFRLSDDELEILFRPLAAAAGLPTPLTKQIVNGYEVDFYWPDLRLVVETDGLRYHRTASAQTRDAERDQTHTAAGFTPLRFSHYQVKYEPDHVRTILTRTRLRLER
jgi:hypothetical protein